MRSQENAWKPLGTDGQHENKMPPVPKGGCNETDANMIAAQIKSIPCHRIKDEPCQKGMTFGLGRNRSKTATF